MSVPSSSLEGCFSFGRDMSFAFSASVKNVHGFATRFFHFMFLILSMVVLVVSRFPFMSTFSKELSFPSKNCVQSG